MDVWISGAFALVGATVGVFLSTYLAQSTRRREAKRARLEEALRCIVRAIAARQFAVHFGMEGQPDSLTDSEIQELEARLYIENLEKVFKTLQEARAAVAVLVADGGGPAHGRSIVSTGFCLLHGTAQQRN